MQSDGGISLHVAGEWLILRALTLPVPTITTLVQKLAGAEIGDFIPGAASVASPVAFGLRATLSSKV